MCFEKSDIKLVSYSAYYRLTIILNTVSGREKFIPCLLILSEELEMLLLMLIS